MISLDNAVIFVKHYLSDIKGYASGQIGWQSIFIPVYLSDCIWFGTRTIISHRLI